MLVGVVALLAILSIPALAADRSVSASAHPDEIVIMVDDLGAIDDRILERLPNIKALFLKHGLQFNRAYSETPLCCPGRASFLTGQHTQHHGVDVNDARLLDPTNTIATALQGAGYYTAMVGKYLNGAANLTDHTPPGWDHVTMLNDWSTTQSSDWWIDDVPTVAGYFDRFIDQSATQLLSEAPAGQPVFMWVAPHAPHKSASSNLDWEPDIEPQYVGDSRCTGIKPWHPPSYALPASPSGFPLDDICRSMLTVDDMVGHLRDEAAAEGRNPIWVLTSDNGMAWGVDGYALKNVPQADRLPFIVSGPGVATGSTDALISNIDEGPTLADLAGTTMPKADGKSFAKALDGKSSARKALLEDHPVGGPTGEGDVVTGPWWGVRTAQWHLVVWNGVHLYDTDTDPWEQHDVAAQHMDVVAQLAGIWNRPIDVSPSPSATSSPSPSLNPSPTPSPSATVTPPSIPPTELPTMSPTPAATATPAQVTSSQPAPTVSPTPTLDSASPVPTKSARPHPSETPVNLDAGPVGRDGGAGSARFVDLGPAVLFGLVALAIAAFLVMLRPRFRPGPG